MPEADSVAHLRRWHKQGRLFLVRSDAQRVVRYAGEHRSLAQLHEQLTGEQAFTFSRSVEYHGKPAWQYVAQRVVVLDRPAKPNRVGAGPRRTVPREPLCLRLVISEVHDKEGRVLAMWYLLSNLSEQVPAERLALWYDWRWRIESYLKLLKGAGQQLKHWQQTTAAGLTRRLLVASMACVVVWKVARDASPATAKARELLVRLSGRQMKRRRPWTEPALLAGFWSLLAMLHTLEQHSLDDLLRIARQLLPNLPFNLPLPAS